MSKELNFGDGYDEVKYLDNSTNFDLVLTTDGTAFDLRQADEITVKIANDSGYIMSKDVDSSTITNPENGEFLLPVDDSIMGVLVPDDYYIEVWLKVNPVTPTTDDQSVTLTVDNNSLEERQSIFPSTGLIGFTIDENIDSDTGEVIPVITFDQFEDQFNDMMAQMQNTVSNVKKGDKGDKGDTGSGLEIKDKVSSVSNLPSTANEGDGYLVGEELYVRVNGTWKDCGPLQGPKGDQGIQGIQGKTGTGVSSTTIQYQIANSATTTPTGTWSNSLIATTQVNPFLWTQVTLNYDDGTSKSFYLVSSKGDKGDKGDKGETGLVGPQGPVGSGLVVKGTVKDASQLPTAGNQEGYCYFVGTDLYVWVNGAWKNCGNVSPDLSKYVTVTDLNNGLSTKVTDNKDGTEQLNGVQVQPFNKLSDTIGGRNMATNPGDVLVPALDGGTWSATTIGNVTPEFFKIINQGTTQPIMISFEINTPDDPTKINLFDRVKIDGCTWGIDGVIGTDYFSILGFKWLEIGNNVWKGTYALQFDQGSDVGNSDNPNVSIMQNKYNKAPHNFTVLGNSLCLYWGTQAIDWTPAPEEKVNVSDMRKPANDVAGIEEVNAKQDKIGYTPADDSKVVHDNHDNTITANGASYDLSKSGLTPLQIVLSGSFNDLPLGTVFTINGLTDGPDSIHSFTTKTFYSSQWAGRKAQIAIADSTNLMFFRTFNGNTHGWSSWTLLSDDSKVAHLSGSNNFDTVPTVNNTPLLTSDKLPDNIVKQGDVIGNIDYIMQNRYSMSDGKLDITTGGVVSDPSSSYKTTGFVYINSLIKNFTIVNSSIISKDALIVAFYDKTMKFISGVSFDGATVNQKTISVPSNTGIIKFSIVYASADSISMYAGSNIIDTNNWPSYSGISLGGKQGATIDDVTNAVNTATASLPKNEDSDFKVLTTTTDGYSGSLNYKVKNGVLYMFGAFQIMGSNDNSLSNKVPIFTLPTEIATRLPAMPSSVDIYVNGKTVTRKCLQSSLSNGFNYFITENGEIVSLPPFNVYNMSTGNTSVQNKVFVGDLSFSLPLN